MTKSVRFVTRLFFVAIIAASSIIASSSAASALPEWMEFWKDDEYEWNGGFYEPPREGFEVTDAVDQNGDPFTFKEHEGKVIFVYFGYTWCPDACPATLAEWREVKAELGDKADDVVFVMVSVDPERDTPERLKEWLGFWDPEFYGVVMSPEDTEAMTKQYGIQATKREGGSASGYLVDHDVSTYVMAPTGELRLTYPLGFDPGDMAEDIDHLMKGD